MSSPNSQTLTVSAAIFVLLLGAYLLSYSGTFTSDDEQLLAGGAQTFSLTGDLAAMQLYGNSRLQGSFQKVDPALSVVGSIVYRSVSATGWGSVQAMFLLTPLWTSVTAVLVFLIGLRWGYSPQLAIWPALFYGLGSMAWPYAKTFFRDPLAGMFIAGAWLCFELAMQETHSAIRLVTHWIALLAVMIGGALSKNIIIPVIPILGLVAVMRYRSSHVHDPAQWRGRVALVCGFALVCVALLARPETPNLFRSSSAYLLSFLEWVTTISHSGFWPAVLGALASPGKGLIFFAPFTALVALSWVFAWRGAWDKLLGPTSYLAAIVIAQSLFYDAHWANPQWGARFLLPALPGLAAATLPGLDWVWQRSKRAASLLASGTLAAGLLTQLPGVLIAPTVYSAILLQTDPQAYNGVAIWDPTHSAIVGHWLLVLSGQPWALAWVRTWPIHAWLVLAVIAGLLSIAGGAAWFLNKALAGRTPWYFAFTGLAAVLGVGIIAAPLTLSVYRDDPAYCSTNTAYRHAVEHLNSQASSGDLVAVRGYLDPFWYCYFNFGRPGSPWVGLPTAGSASRERSPEDPFGQPGIDAGLAAVELFEAAPERFRRLWLVVDSSTPPGAGGVDIEGWLAEHYRLIEVRRFENAPSAQLWLFALQ